MINLLKETIDILQDNGKSINDVDWFGSASTSFNCDLKELLDFNYDDGFGCNEIDENFIIVGSDFWLERHEYDGSEWWEYKTIPTKPVAETGRARIKRTDIFDGNKNK